MGKHRAVTITLKIVLDEYASTEDALKQIQDFLMDSYDIEDLDWAPFDVTAITMTLERDELVYVEDDPTEEDKEIPAWILDAGEA